MPLTGILILAKKLGLQGANVWGHICGKQGKALEFTGHPRILKLEELQSWGL